MNRAQPNHQEWREAGNPGVFRTTEGYEVVGSDGKVVWYLKGEPHTFDCVAHDAMTWVLSEHERMLTHHAPLRVVG